MNKDTYEPYGPEWEAELMKTPKKFIIELYRASCQKRKDAETGHAEGQSKWIKVSEWKPVFNKNILGYTNSGRRLITFFDSRLILDDNDLNDDEEFTYLMPLPTPPTD